MNSEAEDRGKSFRVSYCKSLMHNRKDGKSSPCGDKGAANVLTTKNTASRDDLYHVEDNLLGHAFCVKVFSMLLYRLRTKRGSLFELPDMDRVVASQFLVELRR